MASKSTGCRRTGPEPRSVSAPVPLRLISPSGLAVHVNANGSVRRIDCGDVVVNAFLGNEAEGGPANLYLRRHGARIEWTPLLGPRSPGAVRLDEGSLEVVGEWAGVRFRVSLVLARSSLRGGLEGLHWRVHEPPARVRAAEPERRD